MTAPVFASLVRLAAAGLLLLVVFAFLRRSPKVAIVAWMSVICFVPVWQGVSVGAYFPAYAIVAILTAMSLLPLPTDIRWSRGDLLFGGIAIIVVVESVLGLTTRSASFDLLIVWASAYLFGRLVSQVVDPTWIYAAFGVFFGLAALLALAEFATGINVFIALLPRDSYPVRELGHPAASRICAAR